MASDTTSLKNWIGRTIEAEDMVTPRLIRSFCATLSPHIVDMVERASPGLHWCLAPDIVDAVDISADGHPTKGGFLPPVALPHRMWAGSEVRFTGSLIAGDQVLRRSTIAGIEDKQGRYGPLVFVTIRHEISGVTGIAIEEDQTLVYRGATGVRGGEATAEPKLPPATYEETVEINPLLLFRYSALTFNGHRIHYDFPYATCVEHYAGLVVHGPLQATLLLNFAARIHGSTPLQFSFKATSPATGAPTLILRATSDEGGGLAMEALSTDRRVTMKAKSQW